MSFRNIPIVGGLLQSIFGDVDTPAPPVPPPVPELEPTVQPTGALDEEAARARAIRRRSARKTQGGLIGLQQPEVATRTLLGQ